MILLYCALAGGTIGILEIIGRQSVDRNIVISGKTRVILVLCCIAQSAELVCRLQTENKMYSVSLSVFGGVLLMACAMDCRECMVYRYVWLFGGGAAGLLLTAAMLQAERHADEMIWHCLLFCILQQWWFARMYGRADCHAFCACSVVFSALGMSFSDYVYHMALTFLLLTVVQLLRGNITLRGKLRHPVPMLPYITVAFWLWVDFAC